MARERSIMVSELNELISKLGYSDQELGDLLHVSKLTISRWKEGKNLPFHNVRPQILKKLRDELKEKQ